MIGHDRVLYAGPAPYVHPLPDNRLFNHGLFPDGAAAANNGRPLYLRPGVQAGLIANQNLHIGGEAVVLAPGLACQEVLV